MGNIKTLPSRYASRTLGDLQISGSILVYGQAWNANIGTGRDRYVTSGEMAAAAGATFPGGNPGNVQFNVAGTSFGGEDAYRWNSSTDTLTVSGATWLDGRTLLQGPVQLSGVVRAYDQVRMLGPEDLYGAAIFPRGSAGGLNYYLYGSGYFQGPAVHFQIQNSPSRDQWVDLPVLFDGGVQISGGTTVAYRPIYATNQTGAARYVTSGELSGSSTVGDLQASGVLIVYGSIQGTKTTISRTGTAVSHLKLQNPNNNAGDRWWIGFPHGASDVDSNERARIGVEIGGGGEGRVQVWTGPNGALGEKFKFDEFGNVLIGYTSRPLATSGMVMARGGLYASASSLTLDLQISGATNVYSPLRVLAAKEDFYGFAAFPQGSAGGLTTYTYGSGYYQGSAFHYQIQNSPNRDHWVDLPALFDGGVQISGAPLVAYRPLYATNQTGPTRYVTSGELTTGGATSPASPAGSVQFNNAGSFGGDADLRWDTTAMTLTVSGGGIRIESPAVFRAGATIQASGTVRAYDQVRITNNEDLYGAVFFPRGSIGGLNYYLYGSGYFQGPAVHFSLQNSPSRDQWVDLPVLFDAGVQISGAPLVAYRPLYATQQAGARRYITSGELTPVTTATPGGVDGDVQFNDAGSFGGEHSLRWDGQELRVSGFLTVENTTELKGIVTVGGRVDVGVGPSNQYQTLWGDSSIASDYELVGSGYIGGPVTFESRAGGSASEFVRFLLPVLIHGGTRSNLQVSGIARQYSTAIFGNTASLAGTRISQQGDVQVSGALRVYPSVQHVVAAINPNLDRGAIFTPSVSATAFAQNYVLLGSGLIGGGALVVTNAGYPGASVTFTTMPTYFDDSSGVQLSGGAVAYRPIYATNQTAAGRYVTSGELSAASATTPATPFGAIQFNNAGAFGGDGDLRWDTTAMTLTVSGGGLRVESPALFRPGAGVQISGASVVAYSDVQIGRASSTALLVDASSRGQTLLGHSAPAATLGYNWGLSGSGILRGQILLAKLDPGDRFLVTMPVQLSAFSSLQLSGVTVAYQPLYATNQTAAGRYVTSGELGAAAPSSPVNSVQFNNAGAFGGDIGLRWDGVVDTLTVSGVIDTPAKVEITGRGGYGARFKTPEYDAGGDGYVAYVAGSGIYAGFEYHQALYSGDRIDNEINVVNVLGTQLSGMTRQYAPVRFGNTASLGGTQISAQGDLQVSGGVVVYDAMKVINTSDGHRLAFINSSLSRGAYFTSAGDFFGSTSYALAGSGLQAGPVIARKQVATDTFVFEDINVKFGDAGNNPGVQVSGKLNVYDGAYGGAMTGASRYLTSGELRPVISTLFTDGNEVFAAGYVRSNMMVSTTLASSMLWPENGIEFDVMGAVSAGNNSLINVAGIVVSLGGQILISGAMTLASGLHSARTRGHVYALSQNGRQASDTTHWLYGPSPTATSGALMTGTPGSTGVGSARETSNHYLTISPTANPALEIVYIIISGGLGVYQSFGRTVYARVNRLPTR